MPQRGAGLATRSSTPSFDFDRRYQNAGNGVNAKPHGVMGFLTTKRRVSGKGVKEKHNSVLDDSSTASNMVNESIGTVASNEEPNSRDSLDVELKDTIVVVVPKFVGEGYNIRTIRLEYEWTPPICSSCKVFDHVMDDCHKQLVQDVLKNLKNHRQALKGVQASTSGKRKKTGLSRQEVRNSNLFDALNSVEHDDDLGTNGGSSKVGAIFGVLMLVDDDGKPLNNVDYALVNLDSDSDVEVAYDETTHDSDVEVAYDETTQFTTTNVQMMQAYMRTKIVRSMIIMIFK
nr:zinc knuckle CX2CX4HX4C [Tanacetum cinerariifolium]